MYLVVPKELKPRLRDRILREALPVLPVTSQKVVTKEVTYNIPRHDWKIYIENILGSITDVQSFAVDLDFETFITDKMTVSAVLYCFRIIMKRRGKYRQKFRLAIPKFPGGKCCASMNIATWTWKRFGILSKMNCYL